jgi:hypothetical protein
VGKGRNGEQSSSGPYTTRSSAQLAGMSVLNLRAPPSLPLRFRLRILGQLAKGRGCGSALHPNSCCRLQSPSGEAACVLLGTAGPEQNQSARNTDGAGHQQRDAHSMAARPGDFTSAGSAVRSRACSMDSWVSASYSACRRTVLGVMSRSAQGNGARHRQRQA